MIDINLIRDNPDLVKENIKKKFQDHKLPLVDEVAELDRLNREAIQRAYFLRAQRNSQPAAPVQYSAMPMPNSVQNSFFALRASRHARNRAPPTSSQRSNRDRSGPGAARAARSTSSPTPACSWSANAVRDRVWVCMMFSCVRIGRRPFSAAVPPMAGSVVTHRG